MTTERHSIGKTPVLFEEQIERHEAREGIAEDLEELHSIYHRLLSDFGSGRVEYGPVEVEEQVKGQTVWGSNILWELPPVEKTIGSHKFRVTIQTVPEGYPSSPFWREKLEETASKAAPDSVSILVKVEGPEKNYLLINKANILASRTDGGRAVSKADIKNYTELASVIRSELERNNI